MRMRLLVALAAGLLIGAGEPPPCEELIQGIPEGSWWSGTAMDIAGRQVPAIHEFRAGHFWTTNSLLSPKVGIAYTLNLRATPARIDLDGTKGIFRLNGDTLLICVGSRVRPTSFTHRPKAGQRLYVLKRLPPLSK